MQRAHLCILGGGHRHSFTLLHVLFACALLVRGCQLVCQRVSRRRPPRRHGCGRAADPAAGRSAPSGLKRQSIT